MIKKIAHTALIVRDYEEAKTFYMEKLGFLCVEDIQLPNKRWIRLQAPGQEGSEILLSKASNAEQELVIGNQTGGRVLFFLETDDFQTDYEALKSKGVEFIEGPFNQPYGWVAVCKDLYGNRLDLVGPHN